MLPREAGPQKGPLSDLPQSPPGQVIPCISYPQALSLTPDSIPSDPPLGTSTFCQLEWRHKHINSEYL